MKEWLSDPRAIGALLVTLGGLIKGALDWLWGKYQARARLADELADQAAADVRDQLQRIPDETAALRAFVVRVTNGGGALRDAGSNLYITIVSEARQPGMEPIKRQWQQRRAPPAYRADILQPLIDGVPHQAIDRDEIGQGEVRDQWLVSGDVRSASIVMLDRLEDDSAIWYLAVHHAVPVSELEPEEDDTSVEDTLVGAARLRSVMASVASRVSVYARRL